MSKAGLLAAVAVAASGAPSSPAPEPGGPPASRLTAVWAQEGGFKVPREDLPETRSRAPIRNRVWNGGAIRVFGARNEVVNFALVLEAGLETARDVRVRFAELRGPGGDILRSLPATGDDLFRWVDRPIELFYVRYLKIRGLSVNTWERYDERHVPERMRRRHDAKGRGRGGWEDRPDHDKSYPDIAVPLELHPTFDVEAGTSQTIWVDVYVPKSANAGEYRGVLEVLEGGTRTHAIPVHLDVRDFELPDSPAAKTMLFLGYEDVNKRYLPPDDGDLVLRRMQVDRLRDRHFLLAHRHKVSLVDSNLGPEPWDRDAPRQAWEHRLDGSLFKADRGYAGPGVGTGNGVFSIGTYGSWSWIGEGEDSMHRHLDRWAIWFVDHAPMAEAFLYLVDESTQYEVTETWARWVRSNPGPGRNILSFATVPLPEAGWHLPSLDIPAATLKVAPTEPWERVARVLRDDPRRRLFLYNGGRPASGTFATEDDGTSLRTLGWIQHKLGIHRWFFWESTYYTNYQSGEGDTNVFVEARTFGKADRRDPEIGRTGWNHANGDGVLFYPGTDRVFPSVSYGLPGPIASLRLKLWRRGIQDADYLALAAKVAPAETRKIVERMIPKVGWEVGVDDPDDPTFRHAPVSWPSDPDAWESARAELADLIVKGRRAGGGKPVSGANTP